MYHARKHVESGLEGAFSNNKKIEDFTGKQPYKLMHNEWSLSNENKFHLKKKSVQKELKYLYQKRKKLKCKGLAPI